MSRRLSLLVWTLLAWAVGVLAFAVISDSDAGWHLALGRLGGVVRSNALTWTARDAPWYDTSWLWDDATYWLTARFGLVALQVLTFCVFGVVAFALAWCSGPLAPAIALLLWPRLWVRPHVATWAAVALAVALCERRTLRARAACLLIIAFASNLHSGAPFAAGVLGLHCLAAFWRGRDFRELAVGALAVVALCLNPGGAFDLLSLVWHLRVQEVVVIGEYLPPTLRMEPVFFALLPLCVWLALRVRRERPEQLLLVLVFGVLALRADRMVYEFELVAAPLLAAGLAQLSARGTLAALFTLLCAVSHGAPPLRFGPRFDERALPVRAAAFVEAQGVRGKLFNAYDFGGYLEWALPEVPAFADGRVQCFPRDFWRDFYTAGHSPAQLDAFLRARGAELALVSRASPWLSGRELGQAGPGWALIYWDDLSELYLRRDVPRFVELVQRFEYRLFRPHGLQLAQVGQLPRPEAQALLAELARFEETTSGDFPAALMRCAAERRLALPQAPASCTRAVTLAVQFHAEKLAAAAAQTKAGDSGTPYESPTGVLRR